MFEYEPTAISNAMQKVNEWYDANKLDLFERFRVIANRPKMEGERVGHIVNWPIGTPNIMVAMLKLPENRPKIVEMLVEFRMGMSARGLKGDNLNYSEMQVYLDRLHIDKFIYELGGNELMEAVLSQCIIKGNFRERIIHDEFDGRGK